MVLGQFVLAGEEVIKDSYVTVRISKGPEKVYMKNVGLMTLEEATAEIEGLGLKVGRVSEQYSDSVAAGKIISQSVAQDAEMKKGDVVDLVISKGKDPAKEQKKAPAETRKQQSSEAEAAEAKRQAEAAAEAKRQAEAAAEAQRQAEAAAEEQRQEEAAAEAEAEAKRQAEEAAAQQAADPNRNSAFDLLN